MPFGVHAAAHDEGDYEAHDLAADEHQQHPLGHVQLVLHIVPAGQDGRELQSNFGLNYMSRRNDVRAFWIEL